MHNPPEDMQNASYMINLPSPPPSCGNQLFLSSLCSPAIPVNSGLHSAQRCLEVSDGWTESSSALLLCTSSTLTLLQIRIHENTAAYPAAKSINHNIFFTPISKAAKDKVNGLQDRGYLGEAGKGACLSYSDMS